MNGLTMEMVERLDRLERENRRLKMAGVVALAVIAAVGLMGQATKVPKVVRAEGFVLVNGNGKNLAVMGPRQGGPALTFFGKDGEVRMSLRVSAIGSALLFSDEATAPRLVLALNKDGSPFLNLADKNMKPGVQLYVTEHGNPALSFQDSAGRERTSLGLWRDGRGFFNISDEAGKVIWSAP